MSHTYFVLILHPYNEAVLTHCTKELPTIVHDDSEVYLNTLCAKAQNLVHDAYHLILMQTECEVYEHPSGQKDDNEWDGDYVTKLLIFEIQSEGPLTAPEGFLWIPKEEASLIVVNPTNSSIITFLEQYQQMGLLPNESLHPYSRRGWFTEASTWIRSVAAHHGLDVKRIEQVTSKAEGCVLRAENTDDSVVYFKHIGPSAVRDEIRNSLLLSEFLQEHFRSPIEVSLDKKWMLMHDKGPMLPEDSCSGSANRDLFARVLQKWGTIQKQSIPLTNKLHEFGMEVKNGEMFKGMLREMVSNAEWCHIVSEVVAEAGDELSLDEARFKELLISFSTRVWELLLGYKIPMTLVHGDLNPVNVIHSSHDDIGFIDFSSTCISFPFLDALNLAIVCEAREEDLQSYFTLWSEYETSERTTEVYNLIRHLQPVEALLWFYNRFMSAEECKKVSTRSELRSFIRVVRKVLSTPVQNVSVTVKEEI